MELILISCKICHLLTTLIQLKEKDLSQSFGINFINHSNFLKNHRLALEYIKPIKQNVSDFQLSKKSKIMLGWQYSF